jgi:hypothetical protein
MKQISIFFACLFSSLFTMAQTNESITINGASDEGFITNISFSGSNAQLSYEDGSQKTVDISALSIDFDYTALLSDENDATNQAMLKTFGGKTVKVELSRPMTNGVWNTLCLPFSLTAAQIETIFGNGTKVANFTDAQDNVVNFTTTESIEAGIPCIINPTNSVSTITIEDVELQNLTAGGSVNTTDYALIGTMSTVSPTGNNYYIDSDNTIKKLEDGSNVKPFRAYLSSNGAAINAFTIDGVAVDSDGLLGDVNGDKKVNITDVVLLVNYILGIEDPTFIIGNADINSDNAINITDVTKLVNIIMENE